MPTNLFSMIYVCLRLSAHPDCLTSRAHRSTTCLGGQPFGPLQRIRNRDHVCCSRWSREKTHGICLSRVSGLEVLCSSLHMERLLVRILFAVSTRADDPYREHSDEDLKASDSSRYTRKRSLLQFLRDTLRMIPSRNLKSMV